MENQTNKEAAKDYLYSDREFYNSLTQSERDLVVPVFEAGAEWKEKEIQDISIEFAEWVATSECPFVPSFNNQNEWTDVTKRGIMIVLSSGEIFQEFLKQRDISK